MHILDAGRPQNARGRSQEVAVLAVLVVVLLLAFLLRMWGVTFGYPYVYHIDEASQVNVALRLGQGEVSGIRTTTGFANILFGEYAAWFGLGLLGGELRSAVFAQAWDTHPTFDLVLLGRLTSAFMGTLTVAVVYRLGRAVSGRPAAALAALFLAIAFLHARNSHYARPDVAISLLISAAVLVAVLAVQRGHLGHVCIAAALAGYAVAAKWTAAPAILPVAIAAVSVQARSGAKGGMAARVALGLAAAGVACMAAFALGGFQVFLDIEYYLDYLVLQLGHVSGESFWIWQVDTLPGWLFYLKTLGYGLGALPLAAALVGLAHRFLAAVRSKDLASVLVLSFVLPYYLLMGSTRHYFARYALPLFPFLALFAADGVMAVASWLDLRLPVARRWLVLGLSTVVIMQPLTSSVRHGVLLTRPDTRSVAKEWVEAKIPPGTRFALDWPVYSPPLSRELYSVKEKGQLGLAKHPLEWYREEEFDYLVTSEFVYGLPLLDPAQAKARSDFYSRLDDELELEMEFSPYEDGAPPPIIFEDIYGPATNLWTRERPGPTLRLYQVR